MKNLGSLVDRHVQRAEPVSPSQEVAVNGMARRDRQCVAKVGIPMAPDLSPPVVRAITAWTKRHPDVAEDKTVATVDAVRGAKQVLPLLVKRMRPATVEDWREFLFPLSGRNTGNAPTGQEFEIAVGDIARGMGLVPVCLLTAERVQHALDTMEFFPRVRDLKIFLRSAMDEAEREYLAVIRLAKTPEDQVFVPRPPLTPEEVEDRKRHASAKIKHIAALRMAEEEREAAERAARLARSKPVALRPDVAAALRSRQLQARGMVPLPPKLPWPEPAELAALQARAAALVDTSAPAQPEDETK